jgi:formate hydrogenlyase subunit 3/multisubunit Na+/H+ antiporter MnhD subunit
VLFLASASVVACVPRLSFVSPQLSTAGSLMALALGGALLMTGTSLSASGGSVLGFVPFAVHYDGLSGAFLLALGAFGAAASLSVVGGLGRAPGLKGRVPALPGEHPDSPRRQQRLLVPARLGIDGAAVGIPGRRAATDSRGRLGRQPVSGPDARRHGRDPGRVRDSGRLVRWQLDFEAWQAAAPNLDAAYPQHRHSSWSSSGFATKAGAMPFHIWLPRAHPVAPSHVSAVMSGVMIKTGIYGLIRIVIDVLGRRPDWLGLLILAVGATSAVMGVLYALMQHDIKRLLAFHSIENIGIILIGVGTALLLKSHGATELAALALAAAIFHSINHAVFKSLLFIAAGAVVHATGLRDLNHLGGLGRKMPITMLTFGIGAAAISGLPPLNGFASEWLTFQGLLGAAGSGAVEPIARFAAAGAIGALALTAALAVACFVKATGVAFLGLPRSAAAGAAHEATRSERGAMVALAAACVVLGLAAGPIVANLTNVARGALHSAAVSQALAPLVPAVTAAPRTEGVATYAALVVGLLLIAAVGAVTALALVGRTRTEARRVDTWTCGIAPKPAFQYTATSYSQLIRLFFRRILVPQRTVQIEYHPGTSFPSSIRYRSRITMLLEERLLRPAHELSLRGANIARKVQGGAIQLYIAYSVVAVLLLLLWARWT